MRRISTKELALNMVVARDIFHSDGRILLHAGVTLNDNLIIRLIQIGISSIYIRDEFDDPNIPVVDVVSEATRRETIEIVKHNFAGLEQQRKINTRAVKQVVDNLIDELLANSNILVNLTDIRTFDDYTFAHSVNVCILSIMTGITLSYDSLKLKELGTGALLHDIGKTKIDKAILNKPEELTKEEFNEIKRHTEYGFDILRKYADLSLLSSHVAYQHHERLNGEGYPRRLRAGEIHEFARIAAVADVYDALITDRVTRRGFTPGEALQMLQGISQYYDQDAVKSLANCIALYPVGTLVELNTREQGLVTATRKGATERPTVRVVYDWAGQEIKRPYDVDLYMQNDLFITRTVIRQSGGPQEPVRFDGIKQLL
jgi:HD-GYP domain-containing protein (c-di-GMP phosphodiesterase class II)